MMGLLDLTPEQMRMLDEMVYNSGNASMNLQPQLRPITGAAMSEAEQKFLGNTAPPANIPFDSQSPEMQQYIQEYTRQQQEKLRQKMNPQTPIIDPLIQLIDRIRMSQ